MCINSWIKTQQHLANQAIRSLHNLSTVCNQMDILTSQKIDLFDTLVLPILHYSSQLWGYIDADEIGKVHLKFCRNILSVRNSTHIEALYGELGNIPLSFKRYINIINYWNISVHADKKSLIYKMYNMLLNAVNDRQNYNGKKWTFQVKQLLDSNGLSYIWENQNPTPLQINSIINRIKDTYYQQRYSKINT